MTTTSDDKVASALRAGGHRVTSQRLVLFRAIEELGLHASAEEIARVAAARLPGLSLPTVYATLELFESLGLVRRVDAGGPAALFDPRTEPHAHLACRVCGAVLDLDAAVDAAPARAAALAAGAEADHVDVVLRGRCPDCLAASTPASA
jgi:Fur family ferric uptake transcriptional regulator/Fur family peroxide stress response transcriptional regulator